MEKKELMGSPDLTKAGSSSDSKLGGARVEGKISGGVRLEEHRGPTSSESKNTPVSVLGSILLRTNF